MSIQITSKNIQDLRVVELRSELEKRNMDTTGIKKELVDKLLPVILQEETGVTIPNDSTDAMNSQTEVTKSSTPPPNSDDAIVTTNGTTKEEEPSPTKNEQPCVEESLETRVEDLKKELEAAHEQIDKLKSERAHREDEISRFIAERDEYIKKIATLEVQKQSIEASNEFLTTKAVEKVLSTIKLQQPPPPKAKPEPKTDNKTDKADKAEKGKKKLSKEPLVTVFGDTDLKNINKRNALVELLGGQGLYMGSVRTLLTLPALLTAIEEAKNSIQISGRHSHVVLVSGAANIFANDLNKSPDEVARIIVDVLKRIKSCEGILSVAWVPFCEERSITNSKINNAVISNAAVISGEIEIIDVLTKQKFKPGNASKAPDKITLYSDAGQEVLLSQIIKHAQEKLNIPDELLRKFSKAFHSRNAQAAKKKEVQRANIEAKKALNNALNKRKAGVRRNDEPNRRDVKRLRKDNSSERSNTSMNRRMKKMAEQLERVNRGSGYVSTDMGRGGASVGGGMGTNDLNYYTDEYGDEFDSAYPPQTTAMASTSSVPPLGNPQPWNRPYPQPPQPPATWTAPPSDPFWRAMGNTSTMGYGS